MEVRPPTGVRRISSSHRDPNGNFRRVFRAGHSVGGAVYHSVDTRLTLLLIKYMPHMAYMLTNFSSLINHCSDISPLVEHVLSKSGRT
jgi:hypothetical protein